LGILNLPIWLVSPLFAFVPMNLKPNGFQAWRRMVARSLFTKSEGGGANFPAQVLLGQNLSWSGLKPWALAQGADSLFFIS
jgi:hypothetical protein